MAISKKRLIVASVQGVMKTLERTPASEKKNLIALQLAIDVNKTIATIAETYPEIVGALPSPLSTRGPSTTMGKAPASFLDLEILCEQLLNLIGMVDENPE